MCIKKCKQKVNKDVFCNKHYTKGCSPDDIKIDKDGNKLKYCCHKNCRKFKPELGFKSKLVSFLIFPISLLVFFLKINPYYLLNNYSFII